MTGLGTNFTIKKVESTANSYANCHYDICKNKFIT